jgi:hypothetical protein
VLQTPTTERLFSIRREYNGAESAGTPHRLAYSVRRLETAK